MKTTPPTRKLLVLTSGGDAPGMNAALRAVTRSGHYYGFKVYASRDGYQGLIEQKIIPLNPGDVTNLIQRGGSMIGSGRSPSFLNQKVRTACRAFLKEQGIEYLVAIGGDGTFRGATIFENEGGPKCMGIPGTIDNDIVGTDCTIGYDTARNTALESIDKIRDTASSSHMYFLVETMGRKAGFIAADVALAGGAEFVLTPEFPMSVEKLAESIMAPKRKKKSLIAIVAEADCPGRSFAIAEQLRKLTPNFEYRVCVLGHTQRGGTPTAWDRILASNMGNLAVEALLEGKSKCMTATQNGKYVLAPFPDPEKPSRSLTNEEIINLGMILSS